MDFHETWYGHYAIGGSSINRTFNFLRSTSPQRIVKYVRWEDDDDAITHNPLLMRDDVIASDDANILEDACAWNVA
jgi:hypothetical protein